MASAFFPDLSPNHPKTETPHNKNPAFSSSAQSLGCKRLYLAQFRAFFALDRSTSVGGSFSEKTVKMADGHL